MIQSKYAGFDPISTQKLVDYLLVVTIHSINEPKEQLICLETSQLALVRNTQLRHSKGDLNKNEFCDFKFNVQT